jgi:hypothetical protein
MTLPGKMRYKQACDLQKGFKQTRRVLSSRRLNYDSTGRTQKMDDQNSEKLSRRGFLTALFAAAAVIPVVALGASDAEALESTERQFSSFRHQPRVSRPRSPTRGSRRHRRVARVRHTGRPQPRPDTPAPATPAQ